MSNLVNVYWQDPKTRSRHKVGKLLRNESGFEFSYVDNVEKYFNVGFQLIFPFVDINTIYKSDKLFSAFSCRLPNRKRVDINKILDRYGLSEYDDFELLKLSEGRSPSDSLEFIEGPCFDRFPFVKEMFVAGVRHGELCDESNCELDSVEIGQKLMVCKEINNEHDLYAVVLTYNNKKLGYVPAYFSKEISDLLNNNFNIECEIVSIDKNRKNVLNSCRECIKVKLTVSEPNY